MQFTIELNGDAEQAYERILETLENQAGREIEPEEHAEQVLRQYIAEEYGELIARGDPMQQAQEMPVE